MWAIFAIFILVSGYIYVDAHLPSKYKLKKSVGWNAYFLVAVKGSEFVLLGGIFAIFFIFFLYLLMFLFDIPAYIFGWYEPSGFAYELMTKSFLEVKVPFIIWAVCTMLLSIGSSQDLKKYYKSRENRLKGFREIAESSAVETIILESLDRVQDGILLFVTLKSRKVYIGVVDEVRIDSGDTSDLVLIPFISGYRSRDTLTFNKEHDYAEIYDEMGLWTEDGPLSIKQFRVVVPMDEIEALSLFHLDVYEKFQVKKTALTLE